jgi:hypothetical protein
MTTPPQVPAPAASGQKLPKAGFIWAPIIFVLTGVIGVGMFVGSFFALASMITDFKTVDAGSTAELSLGKGEWYVFAGATTQFGVNQVSVVITDPSGNRVSQNSNPDDWSSSTNDMKYESIGSFDVPSQGTYTVEVSGPSGSKAKIGQISLGLFLFLLIGGIVVGAIGFVVAVIVLVITLVRRSRIKRRNAGPATWAPPTGAPGVPPPPAAVPPSPPSATPPSPPTAPPTPPTPPAPPAPPAG